MPVLAYYLSTIYPQQFLIPEISETLKGSYTKFFGTVRKIVIPPIMHKIFQYPKFSETLKGCPRNFSALWNQKFSTEKRDTPFSSIKLFEPKNFLKNSRIPLQKFLALWDIKISTENRDKPSLIQKFFRYQKISGKQKGSFTKLFVSVLWEKKFRQNRDAPPPMHENFR